MSETIKQYVFKEGLPLEFEMVSLENVVSETGKMSSPHRADFYQIVWVKEGTYVHYIDFMPVTLQPNSALFIGKDKVHFFDLSKNFSAVAILFTDNFFSHSHNDLNYLQSTVLFNAFSEVTILNVDESKNVFSQLVLDMEHELKHDQDDNKGRILKNQLHNFLLFSERELKEKGYSGIKTGPDLDTVLAFRNLLEKEFKQNKVVSNYAANINVSEKKLNKSTAQILGKTPKQIIDERVLLESKRLLVHTSKNVKEIGYELGFEDSSNFINYFKKHVGKTPSEFKQSYGF